MIFMNTMPMTETRGGYHDLSRSCFHPKALKGFRVFCFMKLALIGEIWYNIKKLFSGNERKYHDRPRAFSKDIIISHQKEVIKWV